MVIKKKILIIGPISDFGGRELEVNQMLHFYKENYNVELLSTSFMTKESMALKGISTNEWTTLLKLISTNFLVKLIAFFSKIKNFDTAPFYKYSSNSLIKRLININTLYKECLIKKIKTADRVIFCGQLSTGFLVEVIRICKLFNIKLIFRVTGNITEIPESFEETVIDLKYVITNSNENAGKLKGFNWLNIVVIDQTAMLENKLLQISIDKLEGPLVYGFLGRFSEEKGIRVLLDVFLKTNNHLILAGDGNLKSYVNNAISKNEKITNLGKIEATEINVFFEKIDVLVIPSHTEAGPLVGIEAMASGKIILSTKVGAMEDRLKGTLNQFWFNIDDKSSLLNVIDKINSLNELEFLEIKKDLRNRYNKNYNSLEIKDKYLKIVN